jgi:hypothetical protein
MHAAGQSQRRRGLAPTLFVSLLALSLQPMRVQPLRDLTGFRVEGRESGDINRVTIEVCATPDNPAISAGTGPPPERTSSDAAAVWRHGVADRLASSVSREGAAAKGTYPEAADGEIYEKPHGVKRFGFSVPDRGETDRSWADSGGGQWKRMEEKSSKVGEIGCNIIADSFWLEGHLV